MRSMKSIGAAFSSVEVMLNHLLLLCFIVNWSGRTETAAVVRFPDLSLLLQQRYLSASLVVVGVIQDSSLQSLQVEQDKALRFLDFGYILTHFAYVSLKVAHVTLKAAHIGLKTAHRQRQGLLPRLPRR